LRTRADALGKLGLQGCAGFEVPPGVVQVSLFLGIDGSDGFRAHTIIVAEEPGLSTAVRPGVRTSFHAHAASGRLISSTRIWKNTLRSPACILGGAPRTRAGN